MHVEELSTEANSFLIKILSYEEKDNDKVLWGGVKGRRCWVEVFVVVWVF